MVKKKVDAKVRIRMMRMRLKELERGIVSQRDTIETMRIRYGASCTDNDRLIADTRNAAIEIERLRGELVKANGEINFLRNRPPTRVRGVDPQAEVVMLMKWSMESQINATEHVLDAMGELIDHVSGRKERREREREQLLKGDPDVLDVEHGEKIR